MTLPIRIALVISCFTTVSSASAQDICTGILAYTGREQFSESRQNSVAAEIYNNHCEGSTLNRSSATSVGLEAVVKAIPIKFNFGGSSNEEKMNNFCKIYSSRRAEFSSEILDRSTVVREALGAFNACVSVSARGIHFAPQFGRESVTVDVRRGSDDASVIGVIYNKDLLTCRMPPTGSGDSDRATIATQDSVRKLTGDYLPITCTRTPVTRSSGEKEYPRAEVTIATSRGALLLPIPSDSHMPEQWASQVAEKIDKLSRQRRLECKVVTAKSSNQGRNLGPLNARMSDQDKNAGFQLTGGGCQQISDTPKPYNIFVQDRPDPERSPTSWLCEAVDVPDRGNSQWVVATAILCRLSEP